ncbi:MAG: hypothetical protein IJO65_04775 [Lachnospiraceae bacterium]|nr:hypothetical protein [Lachnospiraceae bacterium]
MEELFDNKDNGVYHLCGILFLFADEKGQQVNIKELTKRKIGCILYKNIIKGYEEKSK